MQIAAPDNVKKWLMSRPGPGLLEDSREKGGLTYSICARRGWRNSRISSVIKSLIPSYSSVCPTTSLLPIASNNLSSTSWINSNLLCLKKNAYFRAEGRRSAIWSESNCIECFRICYEICTRWKNSHSDRCSQYVVNVGKLLALGFVRFIWNSPRSDC